MNRLPRILFGLLWVAVFSGGALHAQAASLYIDPASATLNSGDALTMAVRLDVDEAAGECVNTVDAVISYPANIEPVDVSLGNSILRVWVEEPRINKDDRTITFAGGIPNGYCGRIIGDPRLTNILVEVVFRSPGFVIGADDVADDGSVLLDFGDVTTVYLNDGLGTKAQLATHGSTITLDDRPGSTLKNDWRQQVAADDTPPEEFSIEGPIRDEMGKYYNGKYYVIFQTVDKQTGIDHYEVIEEPLKKSWSYDWGRADAPWVTTRSPYVLKDQSLNSVIRVKAVDKAGNEYIATLLPNESLRTMSQAQLYGYVLNGSVAVLLVVVGFVFWFFVRRRKRRPNKAEFVSNDVETAETEAETVVDDDYREEDQIAYEDEADGNK